MTFPASAARLLIVEDDERADRRSRRDLARLLIIALVLFIASFFSGYRTRSRV